MAVRSRQLAHTRAVPPGVYTAVLVVPLDRVAIVRRFSFVNRAAATRAVRLAVRSGGILADVWTHAAVPVDGYSGVEDTNLVINPGDELHVWSAATPANDLLHFHAGGSLLEGPPA